MTARGQPPPLHLIIQPVGAGVFPCPSVFTESQGLRTSRLDGRQGPCSSRRARAHPALAPRDRGGTERLSEEPQKRLLSATISVIYRRFALSVSYRSGTPLSPPCPGPFQPRDHTAWAPSPADRLAELVKAPAGCLLGPALGPFKLVSAVIPILQRRKLRLRENSLPRLTTRVVGVQPLCTPHPYPLLCLYPPDSPFAFSVPDQGP